MGIHDRDYYREEPPQGFELAGGWSMTTWLIIVTGGVFLANMFTPVTPTYPTGWLMEMLQAKPVTLIKPYLWWQLITYGFAHDTWDVKHIGWNMFGLWVFGRALEDIYGPKEFLRFYLFSIFLGGLIWSGRWCAYLATDPELWARIENIPVGVVGASGAVTAVTLLFCIHYPHQTIRLMFVLPVPAWFLGGMIIVGNVLGMLMSRDHVAFDVHLAGAAFAILYYKFGWNLGRWVPNVSMPKRLFRRSPRLRVHRPSDDGGDSFDHLARQADQLLEKINREGIDSLTAHERRVLEEHARQMRERRQ